MWSFSLLAPGMDAHWDTRHDQEDENSISGPKPAQQQRAMGSCDSTVPAPRPCTSYLNLSAPIRWVMRGSYLEACRAEAVTAVAVEGDEERQESAALVASSLASPTRIVLQTSTHAFSARATTSDKAVSAYPQSSDPKKDSSEENSNKNGEEKTCRFVLQQLLPPTDHIALSGGQHAATTQKKGEGKIEEDPSILIGLSCTYHSEVADESARETPQQYNVRTLSTPMLWEEPRSFFIDCRRSGMYLWSEEAVEYGRKIFDTCLEGPRGHSDHSSGRDHKPHPRVLAEAEVELKWRNRLSTESAGTDDSLGPNISVSLVDRRGGKTLGAVYSWNLPEGTVVGDLVPSVTFLTEYCRAAVF